MTSVNTGGYRVDREVLKRDWWLIAIVVATIIAGFIVYPHLPDKVPAHWNIAGEVDRYASRFWGAFFLPFFNAALYLLLLFSPYFDPRRENYVKFEETYHLFRAMLVVFMAFIWGTIVAASLGYAVQVNLVVPVAISILFIVLGNSLGRVKYNYSFGFRLPWTLASEEVWQKTHRVAGPAMVLAGLLGLVGAFLGKPYNFVLLFGGLAVAVIWPAFYSYRLFNEWKKNGGNTR